MTDNEETPWSKVRLRQTPDNIFQFGPSMEVDIASTVPNGPRIRALALIDTGAHATGISPAVVNMLSLTPTDSGLIHEAGREVIRASIYSARISLPSVDFDIQLPIVGLPSIGGPHDVVLGRDILSNCRLVVDFTTGETVLHIKPKL